MEDIVYIAGIGAMGSKIAWHFHSHNYPCVLLLKNKEQKDKYDKEGIILYLNGGIFRFKPRSVKIQDLKEKIRYIIICVKAYDIINVIDSVSGNLADDSIIILIHNGVGISEKIAEHFPSLKIITGLSYTAAYKEDQFMVHSFEGGPFHFGPSLGTFQDHEIDRAKMILSKAEIPFVWDKDIYPHIWHKFAINCCINILSVFYDCKFRDLLDHLKEVKKITEEISLVLNAYNINIDASVMYNEILKFIPQVKESFSSTWQDVKSNKQTELPYLNSYLVKLARQKNIKVEFNEMILTTLKQRGVCI